MPNPFGRALSNAIQSAGYGTPPLHPQGGPIVPSSTAPQQMSRGQLIAGVLADVLAGAQGRPGAFAAQLGQQQQEERQQAQWGLQRKAGLEDFEAKQRIEQRYKTPDVSPMVRDAQAWAGMTPEQRAAYGQMKQAGAGDPDVFVTLPNGQVYAGPKSGLAMALTGGASAPVDRPAIGAVVPDPRKGGAGPQAPRGFRP